MLGNFPLILITMVVVGGAMKKQIIEKLMQNAMLGKYTEEKISAIKLVVAFGREDHTIENYEKIAQ